MRLKVFIRTTLSVLVASVRSCHGAGPAPRSGQPIRRGRASPPSRRRRAPPNDAPPAPRINAPPRRRNPRDGPRRSRQPAPGPPARRTGGPESSAADQRSRRPTGKDEAVIGERLSPTPRHRVLRLRVRGDQIPRTRQQRRRTVRSSRLAGGTELDQASPSLARLHELRDVDTACERGQWEEGKYRDQGRVGASFDEGPERAERLAGRRRRCAENVARPFARPSAAISSLSVCKVRTSA